MESGLNWLYPLPNVLYPVPLYQNPTYWNRPVVLSPNWSSGEKKMIRYYHKPDGTDTDVRPEEDEICQVQVPGAPEGEVTNYRWDDDAEEWEIIPNTYTDPDIIDKAKEILKIGKYRSTRPEKKRYWHEYDEYEMYPYGTAMIYGTYPHRQESAIPDCEVTEQYKAIIGDVRNRHHGHMAFPHHSGADVSTVLHPQIIDMTKDASGKYDANGVYIPCSCGAEFSGDSDDHSIMCRRHPNYPRHSGYSGN